MAEPIRKVRKQYDKANYQHMKEMLDIDWESMMEPFIQNGDINSMWELFKNKLKEAEDQCVPTKTVVLNGKSSRFGGGKLGKKALAKIKRKGRLWDKYCKTADGETYLEYCKVRNQVRNLTRKAQKILAVC